jgi:hypothetical protein
VTTPLTDSSPWLLLVAAVVSVLAVARFTRLLVHDDFPPALWLRQAYTDAVPEQWAGLVTCPFCLAPWLELVSLLWAWFGGLDLTTLAGALWWLTHTWFALSYLAAMVVVRDQPIVFDDEPTES